MTDDEAVTGDPDFGANDWRVTVRLRDGAEAGRAAEHLSAHKVEGELSGRLGRRIAVGAGGGRELFLYTSGPEAAAAAEESAAELLSGQGLEADYTVERWHPVAEEWQPADVALPATEAEIQAERDRRDAEESRESLAAGVALFEVRVQLPGHREAVALADRLIAEGYSVVRRWRFLVVGANNADQAGEFADLIRSEAPAGSIVSVEEVGAGRPYSVFEIASGSGL